MVEVLNNPEALLDTLFLEIINDVVFAADNPQHENPALTEYEKTESRRRIMAILETMEDEDKARCLDFLDTYIKEYQESGAQSRYHDGE